MTFGVDPKDTFLIVTGSQNDPDAEHLFIIVAGPSADGRFVAVTVSTYRPQIYFCDDSCLIQKGEHEFFTAESFVRYGRTRLFHPGQLEALVDKGNAKRLAPVTDELHGRICSAFLQSAFVPLYAKEAYKSAGGL